uniref:Uncharacterized protein n=1 Tax=Arabidopsis thaliana TaxID=3702 RepID=I6LE63_ARATH|nr:hypothetical protein At1g48095 [Arabidopsis thaliana]
MSLISDSVRSSTFLPNRYIKYLHLIIMNHRCIKKGTVVYVMSDTTTISTYPSKLLILKPNHSTFSRFKTNSPKKPKAVSEYKSDLNTDKGNISGSVLIKIQFKNRPLLTLINKENNKEYPRKADGPNP